MSNLIAQLVDGLYTRCPGMETVEYRHSNPSLYVIRITHSQVCWVAQLCLEVIPFCHLPQVNLGYHIDRRKCLWEMCPIQWRNWWMGFTLAALAWKLWSTTAATHRYMWYVSPIPKYVEWLNCVQRWTLFCHLPQVNLGYHIDRRKFLWEMCPIW